MPELFRLDTVTKQYGESTVLGPIDLGIATGRTTALLGPSGCGKSTILRLLLGLIEPSAGQVTFNRQALTRDRRRDVRRRVGYVIQEGGLFPHLTARANVTLVARELRWPADRVDTRVTELLGLTRLDAALLDRRPGELSGGQRQRVSLMRALMLDPDALLLDEPLGALDPMIRYDLQNDLADIFRALKKTVVLVTHDLAEAAYFAETIVLLRGGRIVQEGGFDDLARSPADAFVTAFMRAQRVPASGGAA
ncbi:MAG TPA: ATP-binding cassette domain-containing protein [Tepidisphaeraceae bacterium]|jgi:osmoprotectant transport system ATP-binding protein